MSAYRPGDTYRNTFFTADDLGAADADTLPTAALKRNGAVDGAVSVTVTRLSTGEYNVSCTIPGGYAAGDSVQVTAAATVGGVAYKGSFPVVVLAAGLGPAGTVAADVFTVQGYTTVATGTVTFPAATLASTANITAGTLTSVGSVTGAVGSVTAPVALAPGASDPSAAPVASSDPVLIIQAMAGRMGVLRKTTYDKVNNVLKVCRADGVTTWFVAPTLTSATADVVGPGA